MGQRRTRATGSGQYALLRSAVRVRSAAVSGAVLLVAGVGLAACSDAPRPEPVPPVTPSASPAAACPASGVAITLGEVDSAGGLRALRVDLVNCGTSSYPVQGYPVVRVLDADRNPLPVTVGHGSAPISAPDAYDAPPQQVVLAPGEKAVARLIWRNTVTDANLPATNGSYLEVAPTGGAAVQIVAPRGGIDLGTTSRLGVSAWALPRSN